MENKCKVIVLLLLTFVFLDLLFILMILRISGVPLQPNPEYYSPIINDPVLCELDENPTCLRKIDQNIVQKLSKNNVSESFTRENCTEDVLLDCELLTRQIRSLAHFYSLIGLDSSNLSTLLEEIIPDVCCFSLRPRKVPVWVLESLSLSCIDTSDALVILVQKGIVTPVNCFVNFFSKMFNIKRNKVHNL